MVFIDIQHREVTLKLVYYGPALSGKTTNLQRLHSSMGNHAGGRLIELSTRDDRTLFFDLLPMRFQTRGGLMIKVKLLTVPGQVIHAATRRIVLQGADGIAFIADSQIKETRNNNESFADLRRNLAENGMTLDDVAMVIQFNKRDLPGIRTDDEITRIAAKGNEPVFKAIAIQGEGVIPTFLGLAESTWVRLEQRYDLATKFGVATDDFLERLAKVIDPDSDPHAEGELDSNEGADDP